MDTKKVLTYTILYMVTGGIVTSLFFLTPNEINTYPLLRTVIVLCAVTLLTKYFIYMLISPWHDVLKFVQKFPKKEPFVSVLIPEYNEETGILSTVGSLLESNYRNMEVIVVNDGSTDNSHKLMTEFVEKNNALNVDGIRRKPIEVRYFYKENEGKGRALNFAIEKAKGDILITIDADCLLLPNTVGNFVRSFDNPEVMAAVGNVKIANTTKIIGVVQYLEFLFSFYFKKAESVLGMIYIIGGAAGAFRREVFDIVGNFDHTTLTEDIELTVRIQKKGMKIVYADDAVIYTEGASDIHGLMEQRLRWKRGLFSTLGKHAELVFSVDSRHNKALCWFLLPLSYFGNIQLGFELFFLAFLYIYSYLTSDFSSFLSGILIVSSMFFVIMAFDDKEHRNPSFFFLAPVGWLLFYLSTFVEFQALVRTIWCIITGKKVTWQKWHRKGISLLNNP